MPAPRKTSGKILARLMRRIRTTARATSTRGSITTGDVDRKADAMKMETVDAAINPATPGRSDMKACSIVADLFSRKKKMPKMNSRIACGSTVATDAITAPGMPATRIPTNVAAFSAIGPGVT